MSIGCLPGKIFTWLFAAHCVDNLTSRRELDLSRAVKAVSPGAYHVSKGSTLRWTFRVKDRRLGSRESHLGDDQMIGCKKWYLITFDHIWSRIMTLDSRQGAPDMFHLLDFDIRIAEYTRWRVWADARFMFCFCLQPFGLSRGKKRRRKIAMTFGIRHVVAGIALHQGDRAQRQGFFGTKQPLFGADWQQWKVCSSLLEKNCSWTMNDVWTYTWGAHASHALDLGVTLLCYWLFYSSGSWLVECQEWRIGWVSSIFLFNLACEVVICNFWHYFNYVSDLYKSLVKYGIKHNPTNQYEPQTEEAHMLTSSTGQLEREITFTTLGWLQSALWQCIFTNLWARGQLPMYANFFEYPVYSLFLMWFVAYWREIHFYCSLASQG